MQPPAQQGSDERGREAGGRPSLIYCGFCSALNPVTNYYCAACGSTLVDAFHASEGLRVYERPDAASRLVEIVPAGTELDILEDPSAPADYVRVRLQQGKLGYVRLADVEALASAMSTAPAPNRPDINTNARGCVTPVGALGALALLVVMATIALLLANRSDRSDTAILGLAFCLVLPLLALMAGLYLYARDREERLEEGVGE
ncbi:MAG: hypothetical protein ACRDJH_23125 [Thermomicrobiales bacterium]